VKASEQEYGGDAKSDVPLRIVDDDRATLAGDDDSAKIESTRRSQRAKDYAVQLEGNTTARTTMRFN
jgi:hypothetical protein